MISTQETVSICNVTGTDLGSRSLMCHVVSSLARSYLRANIVGNQPVCVSGKWYRSYLISISHHIHLSLKATTCWRWLCNRRRMACADELARLLSGGTYPSVLVGGGRSTPL